VKLVIVGATLATVTSKVDEADAPSSSVTVTVAVNGPPSSSAYVCDASARAPVTFEDELESPVPSPQSIETFQGASVPGSSKDPVVNGCEAPSSELCTVAALRLGATFETTTSCEAVAPASESLSVALADTDVAAGPSGKVHEKAPDVLVNDSEPNTAVPLPHPVATEVTSSTPGSLIEYSYVRL
jgi:hypothetical protein